MSETIIGRNVEKSEPKDLWLEVATDSDGQQWWVGEMQPPIDSPKIWMSMDKNGKPEGWKMWDGVQWIPCRQGEVVNHLESLRKIK